MYSVFLSNKGYEPILIFDDRFPSPETALISPTLNVESGQAGSFDATLPPTNVGYSSINHMITEIIVKKNNEEKWRGRVLNPEVDFYNQMKIEVEGELTYLSDTFQPQHEYKTETLRQVIEGILSIHNNKVATKVGDEWIPNENEPIDKVFYAGACFVSDDATDPTGTDKSYRSTDYDTTLACLKKIADNYKGYFIIRKEDNKRYLDFVKDFTKTCQQRIDFGENLLDFSKSFKMEDLCTVAMPIGGRVSDNVGDEMYIYRTEDNRPGDNHEFNYLDSNGVLQYRSDITDGKAGVVYFNEYGLSKGDKMYLTTRSYGEDGEPNPTIWALCDGAGNVYAKGQAGTSESHQIIDIDNKEIEITELGADRLRVSYRGGGQPFKVNRQKAESGLDEHFTIAGYQAVDDDNFKHNPDDIYLIYKPLYQKYGWHEKKLEFNNLTKSEELWSMATYWLTHTQFEQMVLTVTALDLSSMHIQEDEFWINMNVSVYSKPHGLTDNIVLPCTKMSIKLGEPDNTEYTLGKTTPTEISDTQSNVNADLSKLMDDVPTYSATFKSIQENSTQIIDSMYASGTVTFQHDIPGHPEQISSIMISNYNGIDQQTATKRWVWNMGGFGYQSWNESTGQWSNFDVAITMDGTIMGDKIAAHSLIADQLWGGTLTLGYLSYEDPITHVVYHTDGDLRVLSAAGNRIAAVENTYGFTSETDDNDHSSTSTGVYVRMFNGEIGGGFKGQGNSRNQISMIGQNDATGRIRFNQGYDISGNTVYGVDVFAPVFGIRSNHISIGNSINDPYTVYYGLDSEWVTCGNVEIHFVHGIAVEKRNVNNGGE